MFYQFVIKLVFSGASYNRNCFGWSRAKIAIPRWYCGSSRLLVSWFNASLSATFFFNYRLQILDIKALAERV